MDFRSDSPSWISHGGPSPYPKVSLRLRKEFSDPSQSDLGISDTGMKIKSELKSKRDLVDMAKEVGHNTLSRKDVPYLSKGRNTGKGRKNSLRSIKLLRRLQTGFWRPQLFSRRQALSCLFTTMSSTYLHYSSTSPSDYGLLNRYRQHNGDNNEDLEEETDKNTNEPNGQVMTNDMNLQGNDLSNRRRSPFVLGSPTHQPSLARLHGEPLLRPTTALRESSEREALLERIPRINEEGNQSPNNVYGPEIAVWWNEVRFSRI